MHAVWLACMCFIGSHRVQGPRQRWMGEIQKRVMARSAALNCLAQDTDPFKLTYDEKEDRYYGRGSTDDKGPLLGWINVLESHIKNGIELPVNLKFCFEGLPRTASVSVTLNLYTRHGRNWVGRSR